MEVKRITAGELKEKMDSGQDIQILDIRSKMDFLRSDKQIPGSIRMHVNTLLQKLDTLDPSLLTIAYCT